MGFFKDIGKAIGKGAKAVSSVTGKVLKTAAPVATVIPGIGPSVAGAASTLGEVLSPTKQAEIIDAVERDGVVQVNKIEDTIRSVNPSLPTSTVSALATDMTGLAVDKVPTASINDTKSVTTINPFVKAFQWIKSNFLIVGACGLGAYLIFSNKKQRRRRW